MIAIKILPILLEIFQMENNSLTNNFNLLMAYPFYLLIKQLENIHKSIFQKEYLISIIRIAILKSLRFQMCYRMEKAYLQKYFGSLYFRCMIQEH